MRTVVLLSLLAGCESVGCWDADGNVTPGRCECPVDDGAAAALVEVNAVRTAAGLPPVVRLAELDAAAEGHVAYLVQNDPDDNGRSAHDQVPGDTGFTGADHLARAVNAGWSGPRIYENVSRRGDPEQAMFAWMRTVYHRFPMLVPEVSGMGYASVCGDAQRFDVALFAESAPIASSAPVLWPAPGDDFVPGTWDGLERPDPLPDIDGDVGFPISVQFPRGTGRVTGLELFDALGNEVPTRFIDASSDPVSQMDDEMVAIPLQPLDFEATYRVRAQGTGISGEWTEEWSFTTRSAAQTPR